MKKILTIVLSLLTVCNYSCSDDKKKSTMSDERIEMEEEGQLCLTSARIALDKEDFDAARTDIERMRKEFPLALNAREEGILLMDSINLLEAEANIKKLDELMREKKNLNQDSLKIEFEDLLQKAKFYKRKLAHDLQNKKTH